jgi:uncharacterized protein
MRIAHNSRSFFLQGPAGQLEAILWTPAQPGSPSLAAVICHPHPLYGGTLHNKVVYQAAKSLDALGIPVLRFNFRGAGLSAGTHDRGIGEQGDVQVAVQCLMAEFPGVPVLVAGFSFGSWVGLRVGCGHPGVTELIGLGIPVNGSDFNYLWSCTKPKLFVHGANDAHGARPQVGKLVTSLPGESRVVFVEGADHFFVGHLKELDHAITEWLVQRHPELSLR